jgi:hypothetical protein
MDTLLTQPIGVRSLLRVKPRERTKSYDLEIPVDRTFIYEYE